MIEWTLATYDLGYRTGGATLLKGATLVFRPGQMTGVIGPSGSGKSTLIKCLSTVYEPSDGTVRANGEDLQDHRNTFRKHLGYVPQDDVIHRDLRVEQAFYYAAKLRLPPELADSSIEQKIDQITGQLGLSERRRHRIRRLSGGQRKRVNIGIELLADPGVLILDEPASGLDPGTEEDLLRYLRRLATEGRTIILTTHSMQYLDRLDQIVVLVAGRAAFAGSLAELLARFGIGHPAELFRVIQEKEVEI